MFSDLIDDYIDARKAVRQAPVSCKIQYECARDELNRAFDELLNRDELVVTVSGLEFRRP